MRLKVQLNKNLVTEARADKRLTQQEAASAVYLSRVTYNKSENGGIVSLGTARRICDFFGLSYEKTRIRPHKRNGNAA